MAVVSLTASQTQALIVLGVAVASGLIGLVAGVALAVVATKEIHMTISEASSPDQVFQRIRGDFLFFTAWVPAVMFLVGGAIAALVLALT